MIDIQNLKKGKSIRDFLEFSIINIDKPSGPTSFQISHFIKNYLNINKTSHFGTLDPKVTGVLPVALGRACRLNEYFMHKDKTYVGIMRIHEDISDAKLNETIKSFIGKIMQLPPVRSRVRRVERVREVKNFEILEREGKDVLFQAKVQAGTYIRKLVSDLGEKIGGAHMLELRRTKAGIFEEKEAITLYDFESAFEKYKKGDEIQLRGILIPAEEAILKIMPAIQLKSSSLKQLLTGKPLMEDDITKDMPKEEIFSLFYNNKFIGIYKKSDEKNIIARPEFVFN